MNLLTSLETALSNLRTNKMRSALTMLGIIIGVSGVIVMVSMVEGARANVVSEFQRLGSQLIIIFYQPDEEDRRKTTRRIDGMTMDDVRAIREQCSLIKDLSAELPAPGEFTIRYRDKEMKASPNGVQPDFLRLRNSTLDGGRFISDEDIEDWSKVCVLGSKVRQELFGRENPVGKDIDIEGVNLTVIGSLAPKGRSGGQDEDKVLLMPITTIQKRFIGSEIVGVIWAQPRDAAMVNAAMDQVWETLMRRYDNAPGFRVDSQENILNAIGRILTIFGLVSGGVAGLALLVGGIGIMNIMLVSVTERTREIGIRKAVGAKRKDILLQFLIESATVSGIGGLAGIGLGAAISYGLGAASKFFLPGGPGGDSSPGIPINLPVWATLGAFLFSVGIGVFFGIYPAWRAARLDPIQALRYE